MLDWIIDVAREAGAMLRAGFRQQRTLDYKNRSELVTDMDVASERLIVERIAARFPDHHIITEEGGGRERASAWQWLIDPIDGTHNYAHGVPYYAVSIALLENGSPAYGVVYDPTHDECFAAGDGQALLNGAPLRVSTVDSIAQAEVSTGFPYSAGTRADNNIAELAAMVTAFQDLRVMGSAALDLCAVAAGRSDVYWEPDLRPWDSAAGALVVMLAGGRVSDRDGRPFSPWTPGVLASNGLLHQEMLTLLTMNDER